MGWRAFVVALIVVGSASAPAFSQGNPTGTLRGEVRDPGGLPYENLFLINGVDVNENLRGQPLLLFVEDAIQETKVSSGSVSAEFGRFEGGVVNMITKSGGNSFSGSFRTTFTNDAWRSVTPYPG